MLATPLRRAIDIMCNLYANTMPQDAMRSSFDVAPQHDRLGNAEPLAAIFPKGSAPVARRGADGELELVRLQWGFLTPKRSKRTGEPIKPAAWNNARDDSLHKPLWRSSFNERRCLVPATSFAEATGAKPATWHWFAINGAEPRPPFAFAGLWREDMDGFETYTVITTTPNTLTERYHNRMPVILDHTDYAQWLGADTDIAKVLLRPFPAEHMRVVQEGPALRSDPGSPPV